MAKTLLEYVVGLGYETEAAKRIIQSGKVQVNNVEEIVSSIKIKENDIVTIKEIKKWVSRGAEKLLSAIKEFNLDFNNKVVIDIGSSTGGFTQVALAYGATKVYSVDVGTNQLDYKLRVDKRVVVMEKTNLKDLKENMFQENVDYVVSDVSFISLWHVFDTLKNFKSNITLVALIKPQYEAEISQVSSGGYVDEKYHDEIIDKIKTQVNELGFEMINYKKSPITGSKSKNIEYISLFRRKNEKY